MRCTPWEAAVPLTIENDVLEVVVTPGFGARVVSLIDRRTGRDWMARGGVSTSVGEDAAYGVGEAGGWDECFPTVSRWDATHTPWARQLRDHGDLWGRAWRVEDHTPATLKTTFEGALFRFTRTLALEGATLEAAYAVENTGSAPLPFMWALHALLATRPGETLRLPGMTEVDAAYLAANGRRLPPGRLAWPMGRADLPFAIGEVQSSEARFAAKLYGTRAGAASVGGPDGWLDLTWEGVSDLGIWLTYGGWPSPGSGIHHVALEPTTAAVDHLGQAIERGKAAVLPPGETKEWRVAMTLHPGSRAKPGSS